MYIFSYYFSSDRDFIGEQEHIKEKQEECGHKIQESRYKKSEIEKQRYSIENERSMLDSQINKFDLDIASLGNRINRIQIERRDIIAIQRNQLAKFGRDAPRTDEIIKENANRFEQLPIGPIGRRSFLYLFLFLYAQILCHCCKN